MNVGATGGTSKASSIKNWITTKFSTKKEKADNIKDATEGIKDNSKTRARIETFLKAASFVLGTINLAVGVASIGTGVGVAGLGIAAGITHGNIPAAVGGVLMGIGMVGLGVVNVAISDYLIKESGVPQAVTEGVGKLAEGLPVIGEGLKQKREFREFKASVIDDLKADGYLLDSKDEKKISKELGKAFKEQFKANPQNSELVHLAGNHVIEKADEQKITGISGAFAFTKEKIAAKRELRQLMKNESEASDLVGALVDIFKAEGDKQNMKATKELYTEALLDKHPEDLLELYKLGFRAGRARDIVVFGALQNSAARFLLSKAKRVDT